MIVVSKSKGSGGPFIWVSEGKKYNSPTRGTSLANSEHFAVWYAKHYNNKYIAPLELARWES